VLPLLAIVAVTVLWGVTFVRVKDALELYPPRSGTPRWAQRDREKVAIKRLRFS
jgi:hypothetical protein